MIRRQTVIAFIITPLVVVLSPSAVILASAHPASHLAIHQVATKKPTITISGFMFTVPRRVAPGATVKIVNKDIFEHTVTATGGAFDVDLPGQSTAKFRAPKTQGKYPFVCIFHGSMRATLVVK